MPSYKYVGCITAFTEMTGTKILQSNSDVQATQVNNDYAERLIARELLLSGSSSEIACTPTEVRFVPAVTIPEGKNEVILRAKMSTEGQPVQIFNISVSTSNSGFINTPEYIAQTLFLYSGVDLMRQHHAKVHFDYTPSLDFENELQAGQYIEIRGLSSTVVVAEHFTKVHRNIVLTLQMIDDLPAGAVDFVKQQWGHNVTIHSCLSVINGER